MNAKRYDTFTVPRKKSFSQETFIKLLEHKGNSLGTVCLLSA